MTRAVTLPPAPPAAVRLVGLPPVVGAGTVVLVLGSFPGVASLRAQQYYGHPQNHFWKILAAIWQLPLTDMPYPERIDHLQQRGLGLWDVYAACEREGSLDSAIRDEQVNDFAGFFASQPNLAAIGFNGGKAWQSFKRYVLPLQIVPAGIKLITLPSTSPAHAALGFNEKLQQWQQLKPFILNVN